MLIFGIGVIGLLVQVTGGETPSNVIGSPAT
jgi:hypothetical protein